MQYESQLNDTTLYKSSNELTYAENPNITYQSISSHLYETLPRKNPSMTYLTKEEIPRKSTSKMRLSCDLSDLRGYSIPEDVVSQIKEKSQMVTKDEKPILGLFTSDGKLIKLVPFEMPIQPNDEANVSKVIGGGGNLFEKARKAKIYKSSSRYGFTFNINNNNFRSQALR